MLHQTALVSGVLPPAVILKQTLMMLHAIFFSACLIVFLKHCSQPRFLSLSFLTFKLFKIGLNIIYSMRCFQGAICQDFSIQWTSRQAYLHLHSDWKPVFLKEHQYIPSKCVANCAHFNLYSCGWGLCSVILRHQIPCDTPSASRLFCISFCIFATYNVLLQPLLFLTTSQYFQLKI